MTETTLDGGFVLRTADTLEALRADWDRLAPLTANPFLTFEWADAWWRHLGGSGELALHSVHGPDDSAVAILPLYRADRGPTRLLRFLGHGPADELGPVCAPADAATAGRALRRVVADLPRGLLLADRLPQPSGLAGALGARQLRTEPTPVLPVRGLDWEGWMKTKSSHLRSQIRRLERKLAREHELAFRLAEDPDRLQDDLTTFFELHRTRWDATGESVAFAGAREAFHRDFAARALERGWLRLWFADVDGTPVAGSYGIRFSGSDWCYQVGRDPEWNHYRVGFVLLSHTIRTSFEDGMRDFRFGLGDEPYKDRFAEEDPGLETVLAGPGAVTWAASRLAAAGRRLPPDVRQKIVRRAG